MVIEVFDNEVGPFSGDWFTYPVVLSAELDVDSVNMEKKYGGIRVSRLIPEPMPMSSSP